MVEQGGTMLSQWPRSRGRRRVAVCLLAIAGSAIAIVSGGDSTERAMAQGTIDEVTIASYAESVLLLEPPRQAAYAGARQAMGDTPLPSVICSQPDSVRVLPKEARRLAVEYCNQSKGLIESTGLTVDQFNALTDAHGVDETLKQRIQTELLRLQAP